MVYIVTLTDGNVVISITSHPLTYSSTYISSFQFVNSDRKITEHCKTGLNTWIGMNAIILFRISIVNGAENITIKDIKLYYIVADVFGKFIKTRYPKEIITELEKIKSILEFFYKEPSRKSLEFLTEK